MTDEQILARPGPRLTLSLALILSVTLTLALTLTLTPTLTLALTLSLTLTLTLPLTQVLEEQIELIKRVPPPASPILIVRAPSWRVPVPPPSVLDPPLLA